MLFGDVVNGHSYGYASFNTSSTVRKPPFQFQTLTTSYFDNTTFQCTVGMYRLCYSTDDTESVVLSFVIVIRTYAFQTYEIRYTRQRTGEGLQLEPN